MEAKSILEGFTPVEGRRNGNTTRLVDHAIQMLFKHGAIKIESYEQGVETNRERTDLLFDRVKRRLVTEHLGIYSQLEFIKSNSEIRLV